MQEYWIVDPEIEIIKVYRMTDQGYVRIAEWPREADDTITTPLLPGLPISLIEIFEQPQFITPLLNKKDRHQLGGIAAIKDKPGAGDGI